MARITSAFHLHDTTKSEGEWCSSSYTTDTDVLQVVTLDAVVAGKVVLVADLLAAEVVQHSRGARHVDNQELLVVCV